MALLDMIQNLAIIISLAMIYRIISARLHQNTIIIQILVGLLFGSFTIAGMKTPFTMMPGVFYDGRSIILSLAGLFCGPVTTAIAAVIAAAYRISVGGSGVIAGVGTIVESSLFGLAFFYLRRGNKIQVNVTTLLIMGLLVHVAMLLFQLTIPNGMGWMVWQEIGLYVIVFFTAVTLIIGLLFLDSENQLRDKAALQKNEKTLKKAQHLAQVGSWMWRARDNSIEGSDELYNILGLERATFTGSLTDKLMLSIHPDDRKGFDIWADTLVSGRLKQMEFRIVRNSGEIRTVWVETGEMEFDNQGKPVSASGILQDITERRAAEEELVSSETRYRSLIMNSPEAILVNHKDRIAIVNNKAIELFGARDASDLVGRPIMELFHPHYHEIIRERIRQLHETNQPLQIIQEQIIRLDGKVVDVDSNAATFNWHGETDIHVILRDITERIKMEKELRDSRDLLARLADQVPGAVFQFTLMPDGKRLVPFISPGITRILGNTPLMLQDNADLAFKHIHEADLARAMEELSESARALSVVFFEFRILSPENEYRWYQCNAQPERLEHGGTTWYGILSDITDRKMNEEKIAEQLDELRRWQSVMLGREKRAIELKQEVNKLLKEMGQPPRYLVENSISGPDDEPDEAGDYSSNNGT